MLQDSGVQMPPGFPIVGSKKQVRTLTFVYGAVIQINQLPVYLDIRFISFITVLGTSLFEHSVYLVIYGT